jgi:hypothetical protein
LISPVSGLKAAACELSSSGAVEEEGSAAEGAGADSEDSEEDLGEEEERLEGVRDSGTTEEESKRMRSATSDRYFRIRSLSLYQSGHRGQLLQAMDARKRELA